MRRGNVGWPMLVAALVGGSFQPAGAQTTVFSTFGPGDSFDATSGFYAVSSQVWPAAWFLFGGVDGYSLSSIRFAGTPLTGGDPQNAGLTVEFLVGSSMANATLLESWSLPGGPYAPQIYTLPSVNHPELVPGDRYWLMLGAIGAWWGWAESNQGLTGFTQSWDAGASWRDYPPFPAPAFDVRATSADIVPEPATSMLIASGLLVIAGAAVRRRPRSA